MNAIAKSTVPQATAVHSINEFVFSVPDLNEAAEFYTGFGLDVRREGESLALYTVGHSQRWARIVQGAAKRLLWLSFGIYEGDLALWARKLEEQGVATCVPPAGASADGIWFRSLDGLPLQLVVASKCSPSVKSPRVFAEEVSNVGRAPRRSQVRQVRPRHLSHILVFTRDVSASLDFFARVLGLRLSDRSGDIVAFMHSPHGSDHHLLAFAKSDGYGLHHSSWDVASFDDVALGSQQMAAAGFERGWGMGRHVLGSNYFRYVRDPWGSYAEYSFDIDFIPGGADWPAADYPPEDSLYV